MRIVVFLVSVFVYRLGSAEQRPNSDVVSDLQKDLTQHRLEAAHYVSEIKSVLEKHAETDTRVAQAIEDLGKRLDTSSQSRWWDDARRDLLILFASGGLIVGRRRDRRELAKVLEAQTSKR